MSRGLTRVWRPAAVWLAVGAATITAASAVPDSWSSAAAATDGERFADLLVAGCASAAALALGWLWVVTTATVREVLTSSAPVLTQGGAVRRLVLLACGTAVVAGAALPAQAASGGDGAERLVGLPLPERAAAAPREPHQPPPPAPRVAATAASAGADAPSETDDYVVRPGDSLWSIAAAHPDGVTGVESRWRSIWAANRGVVGDDPDLIHPGQALRLPGHTSQDGAP